MLIRPSAGNLTIYFEGRALPARDGDSIAAALLASNIVVTRTTMLSAAARGPYCMMGACFECLAQVDGRTGVQTCLTPVREGMRIERQEGARELSLAAWTTT
jgi:D-hydroxyproline dehydrogenase subunit gamma